MAAWSETTLNYWTVVERHPNLKEEVGGSILGFEISSLPLDTKLVRWSIASCVVAPACRPYVSTKNKNNFMVTALGSRVWKRP